MISAYSTSIRKSGLFPNSEWNCLLDLVSAVVAQRTKSLFSEAAKQMGTLMAASSN